MKIITEKESTMTKEEIELLLIDLSARLPFGVIIHLTEPDENEELYCLNIPQEALYTRCLTYHGATTLCPIEDCRPYLRPLSAMTKEESAEYADVWANRDPYMPGGSVDWLNRHHFDHHGLIPLGLALIAPEDMYNFEKKEDSAEK